MESPVPRPGFITLAPRRGSPGLVSMYLILRLHAWRIARNYRLRFALRLNDVVDQLRARLRDRMSCQKGPSIAQTTSEGTCTALCMRRFYDSHI